MLDVKLAGVLVSFLAFACLHPFEDFQTELLDAGARVWIRVSLERQRVDIMDGEASEYTMIASTGLDDPAGDRTPEGRYHRGRSE